MKTTIALLALFVLILVGGYALYAHNQPASQQATLGITPSAALPAATSSASAAPASPAGTSASSATPSGYTSAEVAQHATSQSCWTSINGSVYDLTKWIAQHPGGMAPILSICGKDGSQAFNQQHGRAGDTRPKEMLATFKIGTLAS